MQDPEAGRMLGRGLVENMSAQKAVRPGAGRRGGRWGGHWREVLARGAEKLFTLQGLASGEVDNLAYWFKNPFMVGLLG